MKQTGAGKFRNLTTKSTRLRRLALKKKSDRTNRESYKETKAEKKAKAKKPKGVFASDSTKQTGDTFIRSWGFGRGSSGMSSRSTDDNISLLNVGREEKNDKRKRGLLDLDW